MKNKKLLFKSGLLAIVCLGFSMSISSAINLKINLKFGEILNGIMVPRVVSALDNMMYVHFADNRNNFGGFMYFSNGATSADSEEGSFEISTDDDGGVIYECSTQVKGFYYNAERGDRLWPLDQDTWSGVQKNTGLETTGGIYTNCAKAGYKDALKACEDDTDYETCVENVRQDYSADGYGYYGHLEQTYSGQNMNLIIGVKYNTGTSFISIEPDSDLFPTFVRIGNKYPVGFIYDYNGGVGLVGCRFESHLDSGSMKRLVDEAQATGLLNIFEYNTDSEELEYKGNSIFTGIKCDAISAADSLVKIIVEGIMGLDSSGSGNIKFGSLGNSTDTKMQYFATKSVNNITMINHARRKAELLCRGKRIHTEPSPNNDKIVCLNNIPKVDANNPVYSGKTLIVKRGDVHITPTKDKIYDIFVEEGKLVVDENTGTQKYVIKSNGFISDTPYSGFDSFLMHTMVDYFGANLETILNTLLTENSYWTVNHDLIYPEFDFFDNGGVVPNRSIGDYDAVVKCVNSSSHCELGDDVAAASVIKGNFIVDGNILGPDEEDQKLKNKYFIYGKMTTKDDISDLEDTFSRRCESGIANDGIFCPGGKTHPTPYQNAALVIIDQNYNSPLLNN